MFVFLRVFVAKICTCLSSHDMVGVLAASKGENWGSLRGILLTYEDDTHEARVRRRRGAVDEDVVDWDCGGNSTHYR